jgi:uncharacterized protein (TIGR03083 family)
MVTLGRSLTPELGERTVPACPEWTVREVYAHQAGVCADILGGQMEGVTTDTWTARQVAERADRSLEEILDEWDRDAPLVVEQLSPVAEHVDLRFLVDQWTHDQDIRGAVDRPGDRDDDRARFVRSAALGLFADRVAAAELESMVVDLDEGTVDPTGPRLRVDHFEFVRALMGRRSAAQMAAWDWPVADPGPYIDAVTAFPPRATDLTEP